MDKEKIAERLKAVPANLHRIFDFVTAGMNPPNRILCGFGAAEQVGSEAAKLTDGKKALLISDEILDNLGSVKDIASSLSSAGFSVETFAKVEAEPHIETADALYEMCDNKNFSVIVGLGGGSVMDISKITAQAVGRGRSSREYVDRKVTPDGPGLPLILLPTTSGTGSEVSNYFVVTKGDEKRFFSDPYYYADIAIIDPLLTVSMPPLVTASTGLDALTHAMEGVMNKKASPFSDAISLAAIELVTGYLRRAVADGEDLEARYNMAMGSALGMMGFILGGGGLYAHSVSYIVPIYKKCSHGMGCALGLPYLMDYNLPVQTEKLAKIAVVMGEATWMHSKIDAAKLAVHGVARLMKDTGLPLTLQEFGGIKETELETMAGQMMTMFPRPNNPRPMGKEEAVKYWQTMWEGNL